MNQFDSWNLVMSDELGRTCFIMLLVSRPGWKNEQYLSGIDLVEGLGTMQANHGLC